MSFVQRLYSKISSVNALHSLFLFIVRKWDYCGIPKCKWNVDCYTERGELYRGYRFYLISFLEKCWLPLVAGLQSSIPNPQTLNALNYESSFCPSWNFSYFRTKTAGNSYNCNDWYSNWPHPHSYDHDGNVKKYGVGHHRYVYHNCVTVPNITSTKSTKNIYRSASIYEWYRYFGRNHLFT